MQTHFLEQHTCVPNGKDTMSCFLSFALCRRHLRDAYETVMFSEGDFDERMFLNGNGEADLALAYKKEDIDR